MTNNSAVPAGLERHLQDMGILLPTEGDLKLENLQRTNTLQQVGYYNDPTDNKGDVSF